jgi:hypothetical protein
MSCADSARAHQPSQDGSNTPSGLPALRVIICTVAHHACSDCFVRSSRLAGASCELSGMSACMSWTCICVCIPVIDMQIFELGANRPLGVHMTMPAIINEQWAVS